MAVAEKQQHKVKKGEVLEGIAKKYGHKNWKTIWEAPDNKKLVQNRGKPEKIEPGDVLVIPPNEKERKEIESKIVALNARRDAEAQLFQSLNEEKTRLNTKLSKYNEIIQWEVKSTQSIIDSLQQNIKGMKNIADAADVVADLLQLGISLAKLSKMTLDSAKVAGEALEELNKKALKEAGQVVKMPFEKVGVKAAASLKDNASTSLAFIGIVFDSWDKMTSPSFWSNTYIQMTHNGKSWSEAVQLEIGDEIRDQIKKIAKQSDDRVKKLNQQKKEIDAQIATNAAFLGDIQKQTKQTESEIDGLPKL